MATDTSSATVVVVDDDRGLLRLVQKALEREGLIVTTAGSGAEAVTWLKRNRADLMLLDLKLQDFEGVELVNHLASIQRNLPFIVITGQGDERVAVEMMKRGALDYLVKDADFLQFVPEVVRRALAELAKEKRLAEAEEQARLGQTVVEQGFSAVLITTTKRHEPEVVYINSAFTRLTGCSAEEVVGKALSHLESLTNTMPEFQRALTEERAFSGERVIRHKDGEERIVDCHITPVLDRTGLRTHWVIIQRDITELKRLEKEVLDISDREQRRIAQDLHDGLGQQLTAIELMCESLRSDLSSTRSGLEKQAAKICKLLREAVSYTRTLAHGLAPFKVETSGLEAALMELAQTTSELGRIKCRARCPTPVLLEDKETASHLYRIAQEAVNNAVKHSQAKEIVIELSSRNGFLRLEVRDDGKGLRTTGKEREGIGLNVMKHRAGVIGAQLEVQSKAGEGVTIICTLRRNR